MNPGYLYTTYYIYTKDARNNSHILYLNAISVHTILSTRNFPSAADYGGSAGFQDIEILSEQPYMDEKDGRKITSLVIRTVTNE
jgi:hypothetical protein